MTLSVFPIQTVCSCSVSALFKTLLIASCLDDYRKYLFNPPKQKSGIQNTTTQIFPCERLRLQKVIICKEKVTLCKGSIPTRAQLLATTNNYRMNHIYHRFKTKLSHSAVSSSRKAFLRCTWISASLTRSSMMRQFLRYHTVKINGMMKPVHTNENPNAPRNQVIATTAQTKSDRRSCVSSRSFFA